MATIADVARRAGVSIATVSRVLSPGAPPHPVSAATARRVREAARELDFVPSALARGLASRRSGLLGLVVPDLADPHYPQIARGAEEVAHQAGLALLMANSLGDPERLRDYLRLLRARRVDALVVSGGGSLGPADLAAIAATGLPCVLIGRPAEATPLPFVAVDNVAAARQATLHLVATGRTRVVHLAGPAAQTTMADRAAGYRAALDERGLGGEIAPTDGSVGAGYTAVVRLLSRSPATRPDGLFAATDRLAIAALSAAAAADVGVPQDLGVVGFDDTPLAGYVRPSLSSVAQPARQLGEAAIRLALRLVACAPVAPVLLQARLVVRESSGAPGTTREARQPLDG